MSGTLLSILHVLTHFTETELNVAGCYRMRLGCVYAPEVGLYVYSRWVKLGMRRIGRTQLVSLIDLGRLGVRVGKGQFQVWATLTQSGDTGGVAGLMGKMLHLVLSVLF